MTHGTAFPANPFERELFYRDDLHEWFIYNGAAWIGFGAVLPHHLTHELGGADQVLGTVPATPRALIHRDAAGRSQIANPAANPDIDNMGSRDTAITVHAGLTTGVHGVGAGTVMGTALAQTITNKRNQPRISLAASGDISPDVTVADMYIRTAQAAAITINNPIGAPVQGEKMIIRLQDDGIARAIAWGGQYRALEYPLSATTVVNKLLYMGFIFNSTDTRWDMVAINQEP